MTFLLLGIRYKRRASRPEERLTRLIENLVATFPELKDGVVPVPSARESSAPAVLLMLPSGSTVPSLEEYLQRLGLDYQMRQLQVAEGEDVLTSPPSGMSPLSLLESARTLVRLGFLERGVDQLHELIRQDPGCAEAYEHLVEAYRKIHDVPKAYRLLLLALPHNQQHGRFHELLGSLCVELGHHERATHHLQEAIRLGSSTAQPYLLLAELFARLGQTERARTSLEEALARVPDHPDALLQLGSMALESGQLQAASEHLARALLHAPDRAECRLKLGWCMLHQGQHYRAEVEFLQVAQGPDAAYHLAARFSLGRLYLALGRYEAAHDILSAIASSHPELAEPHAMLGQALSRLGRPREALAHWRSLLRLQPERESEVLPYLALDLSRCGRHAEALRSVRKAQKERGLRTDLLELQASIHMAEADWEKALIPLQSAEAIDPESATIAFELGWVLENLGASDEANQRYRKSLRLNPASAEAYLGLARLSLQKQAFDVSCVLLEKAAELSPERSDVYDELGLVELLREHYREAYHAFQKASRLEPREARYTVHSAAALYHLGELAQARALLESVPSQTRNEPELSVLTGYLASLFEQPGLRLPAHEYTRLAQRPCGEWRERRPKRGLEKGDRASRGKASA